MKPASHWRDILAQKTIINIRDEPNWMLDFIKAIQLDALSLPLGPPGSGPAWRGKCDDGLLTCRADRDGDCSWIDCPQIRDCEPKSTGRHCPLDRGDDDLA